jgi:hypothetical protein
LQLAPEQRPQKAAEWRAAFGTGATESQPEPEPSSPEDDDETVIAPLRLNPGPQSSAVQPPEPQPEAFRSPWQHAPAEMSVGTADETRVPTTPMPSWPEAPARDTEGDRIEERRIEFSKSKLTVRIAWAGVLAAVAVYLYGEFRHFWR